MILRYSKTTRTLHLIDETLCIESSMLELYLLGRFSDVGTTSKEMVQNVGDAFDVNQIIQRTKQRPLRLPTWHNLQHPWIYILYR